MDRYGWESLKRFFEMVRNLNDSEFLNIKYHAYRSSISALVHYLGMATESRDIEGVCFHWNFSMCSPKLNLSLFRECALDR